MDGQVGWGMTLDDDGSWRKGPWTDQEDKLLIQHVNLHGEGKWNSVSKFTGLRRSGKSCRLRWVNYLRPDLKRGNITAQEEIIIQDLHALWGNRWSAIARHLPGRTDNEIKNYWRTHFKKSKPSKSVQKARASFLLRQQQQRERRLLLQQRIKLDQQQQHEQQEESQQQQKDVEREAGEAETRGSSTAMKQVDQEASLEEMAPPYSITMDYCLVFGGYHVSDGGSTEEEPEEGDDGGSWGCLWNLDDMPC